MWNGLRSRISNVSSKVSKSVERAGKDTLDQLGDTVSKQSSKLVDASQKATTQATNYVTQQTSQAFENAKRQSMSNYRDTNPRAVVSKVSNRILEGSKNAVSRLVSKVTSSTWTIMTNRWNATKSWISSSYRDTMESIRPIGNQTVRSLWWWSLAAVGVYGIATTLPIQLIKLVAPNSLDAATKTNTATDDMPENGNTTTTSNHAAPASHGSSIGSKIPGVSWMLQRNSNDQGGNK